MTKQAKVREWVLREYLGIDGLTLRDCEPEEPGPGEIRLSIEAFSLNWGDMDLMQGRYSFNFSELPARIGCEATGVVDKIGDGVTGVKLGDRLCTLPYFYNMRGSSADSLVIDARYVTKAPANLSSVEASAIWMAYMTAYYPIVELAKASPETSILVTAATGTAGYAALEIGRMYGANMIGTSRYEHNREYLTDGGANHVCVTDDGDITESLMEFSNGKGVNAVFDCIGAGLIGQYSKALAKDAQIFFYGTLDEKLPELPMPELYQANATFKPYSVFNYVEDEEQKNKGLDFVYAALESGKIAPNVDRVFPMEAYPEAWEYVRKARKSHGKVVVSNLE